MTFLTWPIAAIAAGIAIPALVILYFLKLKRRDVEISTTLLWKKAIQDLQANAPFQKLRRNILLLLQLLVLCALLLAVAQPQLSDRGKTNKRHIILIDRSASMASVDGDQVPLIAGAEGGATGGANVGTGTSVTRLETAKKVAKQIVDSLKEPAFLQDSGEEAMVIAFDTTAEVRQTFSANKVELRAAIDSITQTEAPTSIDRAYTLAEAYTGEEKFEEDKGFVPIGPPATIHILSDGRLPDAEKVKAGAQDTVVYHGIGSSTATNVGVTTVRSLRAFDEPKKLSVFVSIQSTAREMVTVEAELSLDGNIVETRDIQVAAANAPPVNPDDPADQGKPWVPGLGGFVFSIERAEAGVGAVRIRVPGEASVTNVLSVDDTAYFVFPPARRLSVAMVSEGNMWLRFALDSLSLSKIDVIKPAEFQKMLDGAGSSDSASLAAYDVFIFDKWLPLVAATTSKSIAPTGTAATPTTGALGTTAPVAPAATGGVVAKPAPPTKVRSLPPGRSLVLGAVPAPPLGVNSIGTYETATVADVQKDHPALGLSGLEKLALGKGVRVELMPDTPVKSIANSDKGPVVLEVTDAATHAMVVTFDPFSTNWALDSGWVLFLADALSYLGEVNTGTAGGLIQTGTVMQSRLPSGAADVTLALPDRESAVLETGADGSVAYGPVNQIGLYTLSWKGQATALDTESGGRARRALAANLTDPMESDTTAAPQLSLAREVVASATDQDVNVTRKLWPYLVLAALVVILLEWFVYNRKVTL